MIPHLYIHLPFCVSRCGYCDFFSSTGRLELADAYIDAILAELDDSAALIGLLQSVYVGGGTPTLMGGKRLEGLLSGVRPLAAAGAEITVEANPSSVSPELADSLLAAGVDRVSLGAQSFEPRLRRNLGRTGDAAQVARAAAALRAAGLDNLGLDLIFGIPGQSMADLGSDLEQALALAPEHLSCYELTVKEGSAYQRRWRRELEAERRRGRDFHEAVSDTLEAHGYRWYETSSYARPGFECRHNMAYWDGADYLGLGAGAWSTVGRDRWRNAPDIDLYLGARGRWEEQRRRERLSLGEKRMERLFLGLRRAEGVPLEGLSGVIDAGQQKLLLANGFLANDDDKICLTRDGRFLADEVCARLLR